MLAYSPMRTALYVIWFLLPLFFLLVSLWTFLEKKSGGDSRKDKASEFFGQAMFALLCVGIAVAIDQYMLQGFVAAVSPDWIPLGFYQIVLLPFVLYVAALAIGPSKQIFITRPYGGKKKKRR